MKTNLIYLYVLILVSKLFTDTRTHIHIIYLIRCTDYLIPDSAN